ncbi:hypothetical protein N7530_004295 [Penicillium desertorum]|uniref:Uncharacterized protein n=1 Tax=Penicillium desertorum TaxID=1303715 RepID=A0A9W9WYY4_9EURO|nr:hypothetical protein N7530_004295 [Penicillium desertorum]
MTGLRLKRHSEHWIGLGTTSMIAPVACSRRTMLYWKESSSPRFEAPVRMAPYVSLCYTCQVL